MSVVELMEKLVEDVQVLVTENAWLKGEILRLKAVVAAPAEVAEAMGKMKVSDSDEDSDYVRIEPSAEPATMEERAQRARKRARGDNALSEKLAAEISAELEGLDEKYRVEALSKIENGKVRECIVNIMQGCDPPSCSAMLAFSNPRAAVVALEVYATLGLKCEPLKASSGCLVITGAKAWYELNVANKQQ